MATVRKRKTARKKAGAKVKTAKPAQPVRKQARLAISGALKRKHAPGRVFVVAGPSGVGKTTLCKRALEKLEGRLHWSVSHTTRPQRQGERDGSDYHFVTIPAFKKMITRGQFVEHAEVHGNYYGTSRKELDRIRKSGGDALVEIDVQGALQIRRKYPTAIRIFILPPSLGALQKRLTGRGTDAKAVIRKRLQNAYWELSQAGEFQFHVVNEDLEQAVEDLVGIIRAEACRAGSSPSIAKKR